MTAVDKSCVWLTDHSRRRRPLSRLTLRTTLGRAVVKTIDQKSFVLTSTSNKSTKVYYLCKSLFSYAYGPTLGQPWLCPLKIRN